jgi:hypothetical protein
VLTRGIVGSHRWEKLVHLELRERCTPPAGAAGGEAAHKCRDCGKRHREIFAVPAELGFEGVKEVVLRWERFVRELRWGREAVKGWAKERTGWQVWGWSRRRMVAGIAYLVYSPNTPVVL